MRRANANTKMKCGKKIIESNLKPVQTSEMEKVLMRQKDRDSDYSIARPLRHVYTTR